MVLMGGRVAITNRRFMAATKVGSHNETGGVVKASHD